MKKILATITAAALMASFTSSIFAAEQTIKGEGLCAKCELHETAKCQTAIRAKEDGKDVIYYADNNDVAKEFHKNICKAPARVTAVGDVHEQDGKKMITLTSIKVDGQ